MSRAVNLSSFLYLIKDVVSEHECVARSAFHIRRRIQGQHPCRWKIISSDSGPCHAPVLRSEHPEESTIALNFYRWEKDLLGPAEGLRPRRQHTLRSLGAASHVSAQVSSVRCAANLLRLAARGRSGHGGMRRLPPAGGPAVDEWQARDASLR